MNLMIEYVSFFNSAKSNFQHLRIDPTLRYFSSLRPQQRIIITIIYWYRLFISESVEVKGRWLSFFDQIFPIKIDIDLYYNFKLDVLATIDNLHHVMYYYFLFNYNYNFLNSHVLPSHLNV